MLSDEPSLEGRVGNLARRTDFPHDLCGGLLGS